MIYNTAELRLFMRKAQDPETAPEELEEISKVSNPYIRAAVANNPSTPASVLELLAYTHGLFIARYIIKNPGSPESLVLYLRARLLLAQASSYCHPEFYKLFDS